MRCKAVCPAKRPCCCNGEIGHTLHICSIADCYCHSVMRYSAENGSAERAMTNDRMSDMAGLHDRWLTNELQ